MPQADQSIKQSISTVCKSNGERREREGEVFGLVCGSLGFPLPIVDRMAPSRPPQPHDCILNIVYCISFSFSQLPALTHPEELELDRGSRFFPIPIPSTHGPHTRPFPPHSHFFTQECRSAPSSSTHNNNEAGRRGRRGRGNARGSTALRPGCSGWGCPASPPSAGGPPQRRRCLLPP